MAGGPGGSGTTASTSKQVPGPTGYTTILMLEPYSYHISLIYLGEKRVQHGAGYRCRFGLRKNKQPNFNNADAAKVDPLTEIPNVASVPIKSATAPATAPTPDELASKSRSDGGDNSEPANDLDYRVVITDNHGLRGDDIRLLGSAANTRSKPQSYRQRRFEEDIIPDVPFRFVVRKHLIGFPIDMSENELNNIRVLWEVKDPAENVSRLLNTGQRAFIQSFVENGRGDSAKPGDDNCRDTHRGLRQATPTQGVPADRVLFDAPYRNQPLVDRATPPAGGGGGGASPLENVLTHNQATAQTIPMQDTLRGATRLTGVDEPFGNVTMKVGVSDVIFRPYPAGGDDYRFLIKLTDAGGTDVRELTLDNDNNFIPAGGGSGGKPAHRSRGAIKIQAHGRRIPFPHCYTTGRMVIWRRINIRMLIFTNSVEPPPSAGDTLRNVINWPQVKRHYREAYVEITGPESTVFVNEAGWRNLFKQYLPTSGAGIPAATFNNNANYGTPHPTIPSTTAQYMQALYPPFMRLPPASFLPGDPTRFTEWQFEHPPGLTRRAVRNACSAAGITAPGRSTRQQDNEGFFVFLTRQPIPTAGIPHPTTAGATIPSVVLGQYVEECQFHMVNILNPATTLAHELGHGLYLRHGNTAEIRTLAAGVPRIYAPASGSNFNVRVFSLRESERSGVFVLDHDAADWNRCVMSNFNDEVTVDFCAVCQLTLRYYDRVRLATNDRNRILAGWNNIQICEIRPGTPNDTLSETPANILQGGTMSIVAVANIETSTVDPPALGLRAARLVNTRPGTRFTLAPAAPGMSVRQATGSDRNFWVVRTGIATTKQDYTLSFIENGQVRDTMTITVA